MPMQPIIYSHAELLILTAGGSFCRLQVWTPQKSEISGDSYDPIRYGIGFRFIDDFDGNG
jgi:hypothetical protein